MQEDNGNDDQQELNIDDTAELLVQTPTLSSVSQYECKVNENIPLNRKRPIDLEYDKENMARVDHDYMALPPNTPKKKQKKTEEVELYQETLQILKDIKEVVGNGLADISANVNKLTEAVRNKNYV